MSFRSRIAITTGDTDGIGPEVVAKALSRIGHTPGSQFYLWRAQSFPQKYLNLLDQSFNRVTVDSWALAQKVSRENPSCLVDIVSSTPPAHWVEQMAYAGVEKKIDALATGPLSKTSILESGFTDIGHTQILQRVSRAKEIYMTFVGQKFNVVLLTGHVPLNKAYEQITASRISHCINLVNECSPLLFGSKQGLPIGLLGCNPHGGESGAIGDKEQRVYLPAISQLKSLGLPIVGPLVPDVAFQEKYWDKYSVYVASYHDQGLIPFKMIHNTLAGVQISLGLPFVRTSVDHGTAKDIFGLGCANDRSMKRAIEIAIKMVDHKAVPELNTQPMISI